MYSGMMMYSSPHMDGDVLLKGNVIQYVISSLLFEEGRTDECRVYAGNTKEIKI